MLLLLHQKEEKLLTQKLLDKTLMMKSIYKLYLAVLLIFSNFLLAGEPPVPQAADMGGASGGGVGPGGAPENPIDMYLIWLALAAVVAIIYYVKNNKKQLA